MQKIWYKTKIPMWLWLLWPWSKLYHFIIIIRKCLYKINILKSYKAPVPVIIVGNIGIGGNGKTPMTLYLAKYLQNLGLKPAIISRGYKKNNSGKTIIVDITSDPKLVGDEPLLMASKNICPVAVNENRRQAIECLLQQYPDISLIISDDGLQHYALKRELEIAMYTTAGNQQLLPMGPLREPISRLATVDLIMQADIKINEKIYNLYDNNKTISIGELKKINGEFKKINNGGKFHAIAGIAHPDRFFTDLLAMGLDIIPHSFPDHYDFKASDLQFSDSLPILMTEKDAVKCQRLMATNPAKFWVVAIDLILDKERLAMLDKKLLDILVCPICKGDLHYRKQGDELICKQDRLAYPIRESVPIMLETEARQLAEDEKY